MLRRDSDEEDQKVQSKRRKVDNPDGELGKLKSYYDTPFHGVNSKGVPDVSNHINCSTCMSAYSLTQGSSDCIIGSNEGSFILSLQILPEKR